MSIYDDTGEESLNVLKDSKINKYQYSSIRKFVGKRVLEIGSGIGNISQYILKDKKQLVVLSDISPDYIKQLKKTFPKKAKFEVYDLEDKKTEKFKKHRLDTIICLNVLEHVKNDRQALKNLYNILIKGGKLILLVPSLRFLYGALDKNLGHFRRYETGEVVKKLNQAGFTIEKRYFMNGLAIPGWWWQGKIMKKKAVSQGDLKLYDAFFPLISLFERFIRPFIGLSIICIAKK
ncbi:class I SAM-dependent methyltransferase [Candidatus Woesearchaeota archaeon]|nr:class I SAM-dependent methyltransferase [Candidatus Woesearchaeota archaeon]